MKVINLIGHDFNNACKMLALKVNGSYEPDIVIGVLTGGGYIGQEMINTLRSVSSNLIYTEVKLQRGSTVVKEVSSVRKILRIMPEKILNVLRIIEVELLELKSYLIKPQRYGEITLSDDVSEFLKIGGKRILLIDDCIDTGYTLKIIKDYIESKYGNNVLKIAVITTAHRRPIINADFQLYKRILIRFPWAYDAKSSSR